MLENKKKTKKGEIIERFDEINGITMKKWYDKREAAFIST